MRRHGRPAAAVVGLALVCAACAHAPPGGHGGHRRPGPRDDHDGRAPHVQLFISPSGQPFRAPPGAPYPVAAWFAQADADHDGRLTRGEFRADADAYFPALDADGDGEISLAEVSIYERDIAPEITGFATDGGGGRRGGPGGRDGGGGFNGLRQGAAAYSLINEPHPIRGADADLSFDVTRAEWRAAADRRFARLDVDADGALTLAELPRSPADHTPPEDKPRRRQPPTDATR